MFNFIRSLFTREKKYPKGVIKIFTEMDDSVLKEKMRKAIRSISENFFIIKDCENFYCVYFPKSLKNVSEYYITYGNSKQEPRIFDQSNKEIYNILVRIRNIHSILVEEEHKKYIMNEKSFM